MKRADRFKIPDIKAVRFLSKLLGKLHIPSCYCMYDEEVHTFNDVGVHIGTTIVRKEAYGFGIREAKDFVERWIDYRPTSAEELSAMQRDYPNMPYPRN